MACKRPHKLTQCICMHIHALTFTCVSLVYLITVYIFCIFALMTGTYLCIYSTWQAEVNYLGDLLHPNLVKLIGFCIEDDQRLLVYEFMPRGSLENHLFRSK